MKSTNKLFADVINMVIDFFSLCYATSKNIPVYERLFDIGFFFASYKKITIKLRAWRKNIKDKKCGVLNHIFDILLNASVDKLIN